MTTINGPKMLGDRITQTVADRQKALNGEAQVLNILYLPATATEDTVHASVENYLDSAATTADKQKMVEARIAFSVTRRIDTMYGDDATKEIGKTIQTDAMNESQELQNSSTSGCHCH